MPEAKVRGYLARRFSFNQAGGRCETCEGAGQKRIEMHFLPDVWITCDACGGARYTPETLAVKFHGKTIADVLNMSVEAALELFANVPRIRRILQTLHDVGLGYIPLGQAAPTLSGGEAQRVKLAAELARPDTGKTLYILDEPTTGLHFDDVRKLLEVIHRLADLGNTVVVIEHNLEVIKTADWVIDLGPEAGAGGGDIVAVGTPETIVGVERSHTGRFLKPVLAAGPLAERPKFDPKAASKAGSNSAGDPSLAVSGNAKPTSKSGSGVPSLAANRDGSDPAFATAYPTSAAILDELFQKVKAPWELDGRKWHTGGRPASNGRPTRWDGRLLDWIVSQIEACAGSSSRMVPADWSQRNVVRIVSSDHDTIRFPFFHATTSSEWVDPPAVLRAKEHVPAGCAGEAIGPDPVPRKQSARALRPASCEIRGRRPISGDHDRRLLARGNPNAKALIRSCKRPWRHFWTSANPARSRKPASWRDLDSLPQTSPQDARILKSPDRAGSHKGRAHGAV